VAVVAVYYWFKGNSREPSSVVYTSSNVREIKLSTQVTMTTYRLVHNQQPQLSGYFNRFEASKPDSIPAQIYLSYWCIRN